MSFDLLVWVVALSAALLSALLFWVGRLWHYEYSNPPITKLGRVRKTAFGVLMGLALFVVLGAFTVMKPTLKFHWEKDHDAAVTLASQQGKALFIDFWANWCQRCNEIEKQTFGQESFLKVLTTSYVPLKVDLTDPGEKEEKVMKRYGAGDNLPTFVLVTPDGKRKKVLDPEALGKGDRTEHIVAELEAFASGKGLKKEKGAFAQALQEGLIWAILAALLGGLVTSLTPCVYPMIPLTVSVIGGSAQGSQARAFRNSLFYVGGMALCYSTLGVVVASVGGQFSALFQSPYFLIAVAAMMLTLAGHMLEVRKIGFLLRVQGKAGEATGKHTGALGIFLMGVLAGFVFAPCVGPILLGVLTYIGESGDVVLGFVFMFTFAVGMGLPFIVLGTFSGLVTKRPGDWMIGVEAAFGAALVAAALYFLVPVVPPLNDLFVWLGSLAS